LTKQKGLHTTDRLDVGHTVHDSCARTIKIIPCYSKREKVHLVFLPEPRWFEHRGNAVTEYQGNFQQLPLSSVI
jgi:hypothetical protein